MTFLINLKLLVCSVLPWSSYNCSFFPQNLISLSLSLFFFWEIEEHNTANTIVYLFGKSNNLTAKCHTKHETCKAHHLYKSCLVKFFVIKFYQHALYHMVSMTKFSQAIYNYTPCKHHPTFTERQNTVTRTQVV